MGLGIFNDGAFLSLTDKDTKLNSVIKLTHDQPMVFGEDSNKGLILDGFNLKVVDLDNKYSIDDVLIHNKHDRNLAMLVCEMTYNNSLPTPVGILYEESKPTYDDMLSTQVKNQIKEKNTGQLKDLIYTKNTWTVN